MTALRNPWTRRTIRRHPGGFVALALATVIPALAASSSGAVSASEPGAAPTSFAPPPATPPGTSLDDLDTLRALEERVQAVSERALPATVHIRISMRSYLSQGTGVLVSGDGLVLTAAHVIGEPGRECTITLSDGRRLRGRTLGLCHDLDCGMLQILGRELQDEEELPHVPVGDDRQLERGDWCVALGHPGGLVEDRPPVVRLGRLQPSRMPPFLRTDCAITPGDSGGPLFNLDGEVVGIHSRIQERVSSNYHVGSSLYQRHWDRMLEGRQWRMGRARLGVQGQDAQPGVRLEQVLPGTAASEAGLQVDDVVLSFEGEPLRDWRDLTMRIRETVPGDEITLLVQRGAERVEIPVTMGSRD